MKNINLILAAILIISTYFDVVKTAAIGDMSVLEYGPGYNTYGHKQMNTAQSRGIQPLVDTIKEEEKYGNDGGIIRNVSTSFIKLTEGASGSVSKVLGKPNENTFNLLQGFYPIFTDIGNRLGGLL